MRLGPLLPWQDGITLALGTAEVGRLEWGGGRGGGPPPSAGRGRGAPPSAGRGAPQGRGRGTAPPPFKRPRLGDFKR